MSEGIIISIVTGGFGIISIILTAYVNYRLGKIRKDVNGRMDELLNLTRKSSNAEGNLEGRSELKNEQDIQNNKT